MNEQLKTYIESQLANNVSWDQIKSDLLSEGWPEDVVEQAHTHFSPEINAVSADNPKSAANISTGLETNGAGTLSAVDTSKTNVPVLLAVIGFVVVAVGAAAFLYVAEIGPFKKALPYSEESLVSGIVTSLARMETFTYSFNGKLEVEDRDPDAVPFELVETKEMQEREEKYARDRVRLKALRSLLSALQNSESSVEELSILEEANTGYSFTNVPNGVSVSTIGANDPLTGEVYEYRTTQDGFELTVTFETDSAIDAIESSLVYAVDTTKIVEDFSVTFTEKSPVFYNLSNDLPKPYFEQLNDAMAFMPPELAFEANLEAVTDRTKENSDWQISMDIDGDFGDLVYKVAGDMIKNETDFYFRIRNMPSIFLGMFAFEKNSWTRVRSEWLEEEGRNYGFSGVPTYLIPSEEEEAEYKTDREELGQFMLEAITIADELQVLSVANEPALKDKNGTELFRYDLAFDKEKIVPFYERIITEAEKYEVTREWDLSNDTALLEYLQSDEFDAVFDYYTKNTSLSLWVNSNGFIEFVEYSIRAVPPEEAVQLANKQARLTLGFGYSNINEPVQIEIPTEYKDAEDVMEEMGFGSELESLENARISGRNASIKQYLASSRPQAEISYNQNEFSYTGVCEDESVRTLLNSAQEVSQGDSNGVTFDTIPSAGSVACLDDDDWFVIQAPLINNGQNLDAYWCVDSEGSVGSGNIQITEISDKCP